MPQDDFRYAKLIATFNFENQLGILCTDCFDDFRKDFPVRSKRYNTKTRVGYIKALICKRNLIRSKNKQTSDRGTAFLDGALMGIIMRCEGGEHECL